jgi:hypothetical protein
MAAQVLRYWGFQPLTASKKCTECDNASLYCFCSDFCKRAYRAEFKPSIYGYKKAPSPEMPSHPTEGKLLRGVFDKDGRQLYYNVQGVPFEGGKYSVKRINPHAWRGFELSWQAYITNIVVPLANESDKEHLLKIQNPISNRHGLMAILGKKTSKHLVSRLYYLLFGIVYNCVQLGIKFPENLIILRNEHNLFYVRPKPCTPQPTTSGVASTSGVAFTPRGKRTKKRNTPQMQNSVEESIGQSSQKRKEKRDRHIQKLQEQANIDAKYKEWLDREEIKFKDCRSYIARHTCKWNPNYEKLVNIPGLGMSGTLDEPSYFTVHRLLREIHIGNGKPDVVIGDGGASCQDQMRNNRMTFPRAAVYGFEMQNLTQYGMHDTKAIEDAYVELDDLLSIYNRQIISTSPVSCAYNVMMTKDSTKHTFKKFLSTACKDPNCNKHMDFYDVPRSKSDGQHFCSTCGFNEQEQRAFFKKESLHIFTWFSKTWDDPDKAMMLKMISSPSSTIDVLFVADEAKDHVSGDVLNLLNSRLINSKWHLARQGFKCCLKGGGDTFTGFIYARNNIVTDMETIKKKIAELEPVQPKEFKTTPDFTMSPLLKMFARLRHSDVRLAERAVQFYMVLNGLWDYVSLPDPASISLYIRNRADDTDVDPIDIILECIKSYGKTFRSRYRYKEHGVHNNARNQGGININRLRSDLTAILDFVHDDNIIYSDTDMICSNCGCTGSPAFVCGHLKSNFRCEWHHIFWVKETTVEELKQSYEERIENAAGQKAKALARDYKARIGDRLGKKSFLYDHTDFIKSLATEEGDVITDNDRSRLLVLKVIEILSNQYEGLSDEDAEREYIHRLKYNITTKNFQLYSRWNRLFKTQRTYQNHWEFNFEGVLYKIPIQTISTTDDKDKRLRLLEKAYLDGMPRAKRIAFESGVDCVIADSLDRAVKYRLKTVLRNTIRRARFHRHSNRLILSLKFDGAPFNKTGDLRSQSVVLLHIANEHFAVTVETLMLCGIINSSEESKETFKMCREIDKSLAEFQKGVSSENPLYVEGLRFNSVDILLTMDLKAANKVLGAGGHASTFYGITHLGLHNGCSGLGNRDQKEALLFKDYFRDTVDESDVLQWKKGDRPILIDNAMRKFIRNQVETSMIEKGHGSRNCHRNRHATAAKKWEGEALKIAKKKGHAFVYKEYFCETEFASVCYCALHFKTVKVLDVLFMSMLALTSYDRYCGRFNAVGSSLDYFLEQLSTHKAFKSQLTSFANDARSMWTKLAIKKTICHTGNGLKKLNSYLSKSDKIHFRLIGRQANVILNNMDLLETILYSALQRGAYNLQNAKIVAGYKEKGLLGKEMEVIISSIICYLISIRNLVYWASRSGLEAYPRRKGMITKEEDHAAYDAKVEQNNKSLKFAAEIMEMLQSNLFPDLCRPYDVSLTHCLPDTLKQLLPLGVTPGYEGLLEQSEKYHSFLGNMPAFNVAKAVSKRRCLHKDLVHPENSVYVESRTQQSRNMYKFGRAWLVNCYFYSQEYSVIEETRDKKVDSTSDIIPQSRFDFFGSRHSCMCGKEGRFSDCQFCSRGRKTEIWKLADSTISLLGSPLSNETRAIFESWKKLRKSQFIEGLRVSFAL